MRESEIDLDTPQPQRGPDGGQYLLENRVGIEGGVDAHDLRIDHCVESCFNRDQVPAQFELIGLVVPRAGHASYRRFDIEVEDQCQVRRGCETGHHPVDFAWLFFPSDPLVSDA